MPKDKDWRSGTLLGAGYALVVSGKIYAVSPEKESLRQMWEKAGAKFADKTPFPEHFVKQVCFILPPWESE